MAFVLTPGHRHEQTAFRELMSQGAVKRPGRGRPKLQPRTIVGDKGYMYVLAIIRGRARNRAAFLAHLTRIPQMLRLEADPPS